MSSKNKFSTNLGKGLARVQLFVDDALAAGFKALKKSAPKENHPPDPTPKGKVVQGLRKTAGFLGDTGAAFYQEYEKLKAKKHQDKKSK